MGLGGGTRADLERRRVAEIQRTRILSAMVDLTHEQGAERVTVAHVVARAGVSRRTFYELFDDREACLLAALNEALERIADAVLGAYRGERGWSERIGAGLTAMLDSSTPSRAWRRCAWSTRSRRARRHWSAEHAWSTR